MSNLWYIFVPKNCTKTLSEMSDEERFYREDNRTDATIDFINWIKKRIKGTNKETYFIYKID